MFVDHSSINRWAIRFLPLLEKVFRKHKRQVGGSWHMDETYIKVKGAWKYLYRAVDHEGKTVDFLRTAQRDKAAAVRFFDKAMKASGVPEKVTMDKSGANKAAMDEINARGEMPIIVRQVKYLNNIVEQDHRAIKRITKPMLNFKSFRAAKNVLAGHRADAHDPQRSAPAGRRYRAVFCRPVLCIVRTNPSRLKNWHPFLPQTRLSTGNATEPRIIYGAHIQYPAQMIQVETGLMHGAAKPKKSRSRKTAD